MIRFRQAVSPDEIPLVRALFREYEALLETSLCFQGFEKELAGLPGAYAPPRGRLLLAEDEGEIAGCGALRPLAPDVCEMKRLYVRGAFRGRGVGRLLTRSLLTEAAAIGYRAIRLDTLPTMTSAIALYRSLDFHEIAAYTQNPIEGALFLEKEL